MLCISDIVLCIYSERGILALT